MAIVETLITAEEFAQMPDSGMPCELVRGKIVMMNAPSWRHGEVCSNLVDVLRHFVIPRGLGRVLCNDTGVITERDPDTVRGADVSYYSYARVPRGFRPKPYAHVAPEAAFEVRSPGDRWPEVVAKAQEYLLAGVSVACVLDPDSETIHVYRNDQSPQVFKAEDRLRLPEIHSEFDVEVCEFFE